MVVTDIYMYLLFYAVSLLRSLTSSLFSNVNARKERYASAVKVFYQDG